MRKGQRNYRDWQCERSKMGVGRRRGDKRWCLCEEVGRGNLEHRGRGQHWPRKWTYHKAVTILEDHGCCFSLTTTAVISILRSLFHEWKPETQRGQITLIISTCSWAWDASLYLFVLALPTVWFFETAERMLTSWQVCKWKDEELKKFWMMKYKHKSPFWATIFYV